MYKSAPLDIFVIFKGIKHREIMHSLLDSGFSANIGNNVQSTGRKINSDAFRALKALSGNSGASQFRVVASGENSPISTVSGVGIIKLSRLDLFLFVLASLLFVFSHSSKRRWNTADATTWTCLFRTCQFSNWSQRSALRRRNETNSLIAAWRNIRSLTLISEFPRSRYFRLDAYYKYCRIKTDES